MSRAARVRSMSCAESESRPVLGPAGNKARTTTTDTRKQASKPLRKVEKMPEPDEAKGKKATPMSVVHNSSSSPPQTPPNCMSAPSILRQQSHKLLKSNLSMNASCSSDASSDSTYSRASTGRLRRRSSTPAPIRRKQFGLKTEKGADTESEPAASPDNSVAAKKRCPWVTPNTDPCYVAFHDEEWGVPVHDDKKLFELLSLCTALAELSWPAILNKRAMFREVFMDFDPIAVSKLNEKKTLTPGSAASALLSEVKLRAIIENARQICRIIDEFGSFDKYIWNFVNGNVIVSQFRYPRQVPIRTSKADVISKDMVKRGFRGVGPTVVYSFMQVSGLTNDHLISCFRFPECVAAADSTYKDGNIEGGGKVEDNRKPENTTDLGLVREIDDLSLLSVE